MDLGTKKANFALHDVKRWVFVIEVKSVYCAVRAWALYNTDMVHLLKVTSTFNKMIQ
jgi:hypothetical protein